MYNMKNAATEHIFPFSEKNCIFFGNSFYTSSVSVAVSLSRNENDNQANNF